METFKMSDLEDNPEPKASKKIQHTVQSMLKQMEVTDEEIKYRMDNFDEIDVAKEYMKYLKCTKCDRNIQNSIKKGEEVGIHPLLGVLMCNSCCDYYGDGDFSLDSEGEDKYCRWCGEGGTIFACSKCICGFCEGCIEKHFGESGLEEVKNDDDWTCYFCDSKPLWNLRSICFLANEASKNKREYFKKIIEDRNLKNKKRKNKNDSSSSDSESSISVKKKKRKKLSKNYRKTVEDKRSIEYKEENHSNSELENDSKTAVKNSNCESKDLDFENKRGIVLKKLKSIWRLTHTVMEVGLSSCREKLRTLSSTDNFKTLELLKSENEELKSCMKVLLSSLTIASNSQNSIKEDLTFDDANDEKELFSSEETKLKRLANRLLEESNVETSVDSDGDSSWVETKRKKKGKGKGLNIGKEKKILKSPENDERGKNVSVSLFDSGSEKENGNLSKKSIDAKPLLKVKSFAKMLNENVYDKNKISDDEPVIVNLYEVDTDEGENEKAEKEIRNTPKKKKSEGLENEISGSENEEKKEKPDWSLDGNKSEEEKNECIENKTNELENKKSRKKKERRKQRENSSSSSKSNDSDNDERKNSSDKSKDSSDDKAKKEKEDSTDQALSDEDEPKIRKTRSKKKRQRALKDTFEKYKEKRLKFLRSVNDKPKSKTTKPLESSDSENEVKSKKLKKNRILNSSDEENEKEEIEIKEKSEKEKSESDSTKSLTESSSDEKESMKRKKVTRKKKSSDSSEKESERKQDSSDSSDEKEAQKKKKGRRNIKKILKKDSLKLETKEALKNEKERKERIKEKHRLYEELFLIEKEKNSPKQIVLDFDMKTKEPLVTVHKKLAKKLKPHQVDGVRFMWDNCFESVERLETESGSGCILAHCMGLGKTLQVITLVHTVMTHDLGVNTVLIVCPLSTVSNWIREFEVWLKDIHTDPITLYDIVKYKKLEERAYHLKNWHKIGGVLVLSYDMFRNLTKVSSKVMKRKAKVVAMFEEALIDPGPDLIVCDEGHLLKNEDTTLSKCISRVKTSRRIVLTGTPLQNNLMEYHCMVQFVKPNILGTKKEFCNQFVNPINNGQFEDSTELDVKIMKRRSHVLHSMLDGCVQRFDYSVLTPLLPEKHEYVLSICLTESQAKAYLYFLKHLSKKALGNSKTVSLFNDYHTLQRVWTHPRTLFMQSKKESLKEALQSDSEGSLKDFIVSSDEESLGSKSSSSSIQEIAPVKRILRSNANDPEVKKAIEEQEKELEKHWWNKFYDEKALDDLRESNKLVLLFALLKICEEKKDKVLVFSQSLYTLDLIEYFLAKIDENNKKNNETLCGHQSTWHLGSDYFRFDGSTNSEMRAIWCKHFNRKSNTRARLFLISTRAGGLGINLHGANRVVVFDASWNPSHDLQSIFRVYRFGQEKTCYIYRFLSEATMEEKIYERQITKLSLAHRIVDEHQIERHYTMGNLQELYTFEPTPKDQRKVPNLPKDSVLADLLAQHKDIIVKYHEHDSLLENKQEEELSVEERKAAWKEYEEEKAQKSNPLYLGMMQQMAMMQQAPGGIIVRGPNPVYFNQINVGHQVLNPLYLQTIPLNAIQRGVHVGVTPLPGENFQSFMNRVFLRESWMKEQVQVQVQSSGQ